MVKTWVAVASSNLCQIYQYDGKEKTLELVKELSHPASRLKGSDLTSDKPGRYKMPKNPRSSFEPNKSPHEVEVEQFVRQIAHELEAGYNDHHYKNLVLIALEHLSGLIHAAIHKNVKECLVADIHKDYVHSTAAEIANTMQSVLRKKPKY